MTTNKTLATYVLTHNQAVLHFLDEHGELETINVLQESNPIAFNEVRLALSTYGTDKSMSDENIYALVSETTLTVDPHTLQHEAMVKRIDDHVMGGPTPYNFASIFDEEKNAYVGLYYRDNEGEVYKIGDTLYQKFVEMHKSENAIEALIRFTTKLYKNPSSRSIEQVFNFLANGSFPIDLDGDFYALKNVRRTDGGLNLVDIYSGKKNNNINAVVKEKRNKISDDPDKTCHYGLHACSHTYLRYYRTASSANVVIIVKINPMNVVCVPNDYKHAKLRCCEYKVINEIEGDNISEFIKAGLMDTDGIFEYVYTSDFMDTVEADDFYSGREDAIKDRPKPSYPSEAYLAGYENGLEALIIQEEDEEKDGYYDDDDDDFIYM